MVLEPLKLAARTLFFRQLVAEAMAAEMQRATPEVTAACSGELDSNPALWEQHSLPLRWLVHRSEHAHL